MAGRLVIPLVRACASSWSDLATDATRRWRPCSKVSEVCRSDSDRSDMRRDSSAIMLASLSTSSSSPSLLFSLLLFSFLSLIDDVDCRDDRDDER